MVYVCASANVDHHYPSLLLDFKGDSGFINYSFTLKRFNAALKLRTRNDE
jgi:hypothetical protein